MSGWHLVERQETLHDKYMQGRELRAEEMVDLRKSGLLNGKAARMTRADQAAQEGHPRAPSWPKRLLWWK